MIDEKRVLIKQTQLNCIYKAAVEGFSPLIYWNNQGEPEIMPLEELCVLFDVHTKQEGSGQPRAQITAFYCSNFTVTVILEVWSEYCQESEK